MMARRKLRACIMSQVRGEDDSWIGLVTNHLFPGLSKDVVGIP